MNEANSDFFFWGLTGLLMLFALGLLAILITGRRRGIDDQSYGQSYGQPYRKDTSPGADRSTFLD